MKVDFDIQIQPEDKLILQMTALGGRPYVNVEADGDPDSVTFIVRAGGGAITADADEATAELAEFFEMLGGLLRDGVVTVKSEAETSEDDEDDEDIVP